VVEAQRVPLPWKVPPLLVHWAWVVTRQLTPKGETMQQAPVAGGGQAVAVAQLVPAPWKVPPWAVHCAWVRVWHTSCPVAGSGMQQAPVGAVFTQVVAVQAEPGPKNTPLSAAHSAWVLMRHVTRPPLATQQAPVPGVMLEQVVDVQGTLSPR
jgi:hypothetical protein